MPNKQIAPSKSKRDELVGNINALRDELNDVEYRIAELMEQQWALRDELDELEVQLDDLDIEAASEAIETESAQPTAA